MNLLLQSMQETDSLVSTNKARDAFKAFLESRANPISDVFRELFSTSPDKEWSNITIKFTGGHAAQVTCNTGAASVSQAHSHTQMSMTYGRFALLNKQRNLLEGFVDERD